IIKSQDFFNDVKYLARILYSAKEIIKQLADVYIKLVQLVSAIYHIPTITEYNNAAINNWKSFGALKILAITPHNAECERTLWSKKDMAKIHSYYISNADTELTHTTIFMELKDEDENDVTMIDETFYIRRGNWK
ncbi:8985_t:CDS:2, partial [Gigaspora margarita]